MKKLFKFVGYSLLTIMLLVAIVLVYIKTALPKVGDPENLSIAYTPERIERGRNPGPRAVTAKRHRPVDDRFGVLQIFKRNVALR